MYGETNMISTMVTITVLALLFIGASFYIGWKVRKDDKKK